MKCYEHSLGVLILHHTGGMKKKRLIMAVGGRLQRALLLLQRLHNACWNCKDNKSNVIDCNTVLECFCDHQSHLQWITKTTANAYDAWQTEMDSRRHKHIASLRLVLVQRFSEFRFKLKRIQIINQMKMSCIVIEICQKSSLSFILNTRMNIWSFLMCVMF